MTLGPDIKEVLAEVGITATILRSPANITGEYIKINVNAQVTKPFIKEFFLEVVLAHDTAINSGDWVQTPDGRTFVVVNRTPVVFESVVYSYSSVFYKCNAVGILQRQQPGRTNYKTSPTWNAVVSPCYALLTESLYGNDLDEGTRIGKLVLKSYDCYIPHSKGAMIGDRFYLSSSEYYQVEAIATRRFDSVDLLTLGEDTRE